MSNINNYYICDKDKLLESLVDILSDKVMTKKQATVYKLCIKDCKTQLEVAKELHLSQPTVSRHLKSAIEVVQHYGFILLKILRDSSIDTELFYKSLHIPVEEMTSEEVSKVEKIIKEEPILTLEELQDLLNNKDILYNN